MRTTIMRIIGVCGILGLVVVSTGCSSTFKYLAINQAVGFATAITSAITTSLIQSLLGGT